MILTGRDLARIRSNRMARSVVRGQSFGVHMIAVDSKGNIQTGEVFNGERVQRSGPVN